MIHTYEFVCIQSLFGINKNGGGGVVGGVTAMIASAILVPGSNPHLDTIMLANLANFHVAAILAISTYLKPNIYDFRMVTYNIPLKPIKEDTPWIFVDNHHVAAKRQKPKRPPSNVAHENRLPSLVLTQMNLPRSGKYPLPQ
jgi:hypothetical protein